MHRYAHHGVFSFVAGHADEQMTMPLHWSDSWKSGRLTEDDAGQAYLIAAGEAPGRRPQELGRFAPSDDRPGCWVAERGETEFCAMVFQ